MIVLLVGLKVSIWKESESDSVLFWLWALAANLLEKCFA